MEKNDERCYECQQCKASYHILNILFRDQKPTILLFSGDGTCRFARMTSRDYEKKPISFFGEFSGPCKLSYTRTSAKKVIYFHLWQNRIEFPLVETVNQKFNSSLTLYTSSLQ